MPVCAWLRYGPAGVALGVSGLPSDVAARVVGYTGTGANHAIMITNEVILRYMVHRAGVTEIELNPEGGLVPVMTQEYIERTQRGRVVRVNGDRPL